MPGIWRISRAADEATKDFCDRLGEPRDEDEARARPSIVATFRAGYLVGVRDASRGFR